MNIDYNIEYMRDVSGGNQLNLLEGGQQDNTHIFNINCEHYHRYFSFDWCTHQNRAKTKVPF